MGYTVEVDENIYDALLSSVGKENLGKKLEELLFASVESLLEDYIKKILGFEKKYGISFSEFEKLWDSGAIENRHSYETYSGPFLPNFRESSINIFRSARSHI